MKFTVLDSPLGELLATRDDDGITGLYLPTGRNPRHAHPSWQRDDDAFADLRGQLDEYFAGGRQTFDLPMHPVGTEFQQRVWRALADIPYGCTASYGATAVVIGAPGSARAVGMANGQNPISILVPCHRVIGADGSLTGYGGGTDAKRWLLSHEQKHAGLTLGVTSAVQWKLFWVASSPSAISASTASAARSSRNGTSARSAAAKSRST